MDSTIAANYSPEGLMQRVKGLVQSMSANGAPITVEQLAPFDQFHTGGIAATERLAQMLDVKRGASILDAGSGLGGPARVFSARKHLHVLGVDISPSFVDAARYLSEVTALSDNVRFLVGDVCNWHAGEESFDAVVMQHVAMNIENRGQLYLNIKRMLKRRATFLAYDVVCLGDKPTYPLPWAPDESTSFLLTANETEDALERAGFTIASTQLDGEAAAASFPASAPTPLPFAQLLGISDMPQRIANLREGLLNKSLAILTVRAVRD